MTDQEDRDTLDKFRTMIIGRVQSGYWNQRDAMRFFDLIRNHILKEVRNVERANVQPGGEIIHPQEHAGELSVLPTAVQEDSTGGT